MIASRILALALAAAMLCGCAVLFRPDARWEPKNEGPTR